MEIILIILGIILCVAGITVICLLGMIMVNIYYKTKRDNISLGNLSFKEKLDNSDKLFDMIDSIITIEIASIIKEYSILGTAYPYNRTDDDIKLIATNTFKALKPMVFNDNNNTILNESYIMEYITKTSTRLLLQVVIQHNGSVGSLS